MDHTHGGAVDQSMATLQPPHDLIGVQGVQFLDLEVGVGLRVSVSVGGGGVVCGRRHGWVVAVGGARGRGQWCCCLWCYVWLCCWSWLCVAVLLVVVVCGCAVGRGCVGCGCCFRSGGGTAGHSRFNPFFLFLVFCPYTGDRRAVGGSGVVSGHDLHLRVLARPLAVRLPSNLLPSKLLPCNLLPSNLPPATCYMLSCNLLPSSLLPCNLVPCNLVPCNRRSPVFRYLATWYF